jgi:predicted PurR-regulated permease PerM
MRARQRKSAIRNQQSAIGVIMNGMILFLGAMLLLWLGRPILVPILVAVFVWYLLNAISEYYRKIMPRYRVEKKSILSRAFDILAALLSLATLSAFGYLFITRISPTFAELMHQLPAIQTKFASLGNYLSHTFGITYGVKNLPEITGIIANIGTSLASIATSAGMMCVYLVFMFIEQSTFHKKFAALFPAKQQYKKMEYILGSIDANMKKYLFMKTLMAGVSALASYLWLQHLGLEFAGVWAFIIFLTSYIPTIGAIVSTALPVLFSLVVADTFTMPILTAVGLIAIQILFGNIIEPKLTGKTLNLSTLAILINLVFWGMVWGVAGMFFSVPLLVGVFIVTAQFDSTRWIAVLLSADGNIPDKRDE